MIFQAPPIRWKRYEMPHPEREKRAWSPQRLAAAARAVQREKDAVPLFPGMARYQTVAERVADRDEDEAAFRARMRQHRADLWRRTRRTLRSLPKITQAGILIYWREAGYPPDPLYLLQIIVEDRRRSAWRRLRELRMFRKIGQIKDPAKRAELVGRLPK